MSETTIEKCNSEYILVLARIFVKQHIICEQTHPIFSRIPGAGGLNYLQKRNFAESLAEKIKNVIVQEVESEA